ncbi:MAG: hypothetical protein ABL949_15435 [Fimbriimonadaceae bacterium]
MKRRGQTLAATLICLVIMGMLVMVFMYGSTGGKSSRKDGKGTTLPGLAMYKARDEACKSNLSQTRSSLEIARANAGDEPPTSLSDTRLAPEFLRCPIGKEPYTYDPATGEVKCAHPGHDKY